MESASERLRWPRRVKTPAVLQMEAAECGAATLSMILGHYGRIEPLPKLRQECGVSRDGSKASNMLKAARRYGMEAKGYSKSLGKLSELQTPYVVFWHFNHFVVVEGFRGDSVFLNDPATGHRTVTMDEFDDGYTGVVLVFRPGEGFAPGGRRPSLVKALHRRLQGAYGAVLYALCAGLFLTIPGILVPALSQVFVDQVVIGGRDDWLRPVIAAMLVLRLVQGLLTLMQRRFLRRFRVGLAARLTAHFFWHLLRLPAAFYAQRFAGEVSSRSSLNHRIAGVLSGQLAQTLISTAMMIFYALAMWVYDPVLTLVAFAAAAVNVVVLRWMSKRRTEDRMRRLQATGKVAGIAIGGLQNIESLKAAGHEDGFFARWAGTFAGATNTSHEIALRNVRVGILPRLVGPLTTLVILVLGGFRVVDGLLSIGGLVAFQSLMGRFLAPVHQLVGLGQSLQQLRADLTRLDDVLAHPTDPGAPGSAGGEVRAASELRLPGRLDVEDLSFGYSPLDPPLIDGLSFSVRPGERVALVGGSGSGKSTIARIVCGLHAPWGGTVRFDGKAREEIPHGLMTSALALVDQDIVLFEGTVRANLTMWDDTVPEPHLLDALRDAEILDEVMAMPGGLDATLDEGGANLSGGQRQRLEIARALVNRPRILVLDEATGALDAETERLISERLRLRGCTCVLVAHRLSTIRDCEEIIVLDHGRVVERGTHTDLWSADGAYASLLKGDDAVATTAVP
jgi:ATP-binding cassette subfamily C protein